MGLDITAYSRVRPVQCPQGIECTAHIYPPYRNEHFPAQAEDIQETCYAKLPGAKEHHFRAGSYSGYNWWRDELAEMAVGEAFTELINFSDCQGVIGPKTSGKLARDFAAFQTNADARRDDNTMFSAKYNLWREAFELAADGGFVRFH